MTLNLILKFNTEELLHPFKVWEEFSLGEIFTHIPNSIYPEMVSEQRYEEDDEEKKKETKHRNFEKRPVMQDNIMKH